MFHPEGPSFFELARQALSSTERGYDLLAPKFDTTPFRTPAPLLRSAAPYLGAPRSLRSALDLCCGTGAGLEMLRPLCREQLVGVDFSCGMLEVAEKNLAGAAGEAALALVRSDILDLDYENEFDVATCFSACGHVRRRDEVRFLKVVRRALRPGGRFFFISGERPPPWSPGLWFALAFNTAMALRNLIWRPPFIMYYLTFLLPSARSLIEEQGFRVESHRGFCPEFPHWHLVVATKSAESPAEDDFSSVTVQR